MNGPFPAGHHDITIFRNEGGLNTKIAARKRAFGDEGYRGEQQISTRNPLDSAIVNEFKERARARHKTFKRADQKF